MSGILLNFSLLSWCLVHTHWFYPSLLLGMAAALQIYLMQRFLTRSNREAARFLMAVKYRDFTQVFSPGPPDTAYDELHEGFNDVIRTLRDLRTEKEAQYKFLQTVIDFMDTGLLCFSTDGKVELMNNSLRKIIGTPYINSYAAMAQRSPLLWEAVNRLQAGQSEVLVLNSGPEPGSYLININMFKNMEREFRTVTIRNVSLLLENTQNEAWRKLMRILTHEIMNSIAPIASLADTLTHRLDEGQTPDREDLRAGMSAIHKRSRGLLRFVEAYRNLNNLPKPVPAPLNAETLLEQLYDLMLPEMQRRGITFTLTLPDELLILQADSLLTEQALINLLKNAMEAVSNTEKARIAMSAGFSNNNRPEITVADNGPGVPAELGEHIFVPFFSTRPNGSGVGLSLVRQIMVSQKGNVSVREAQGGGSIFVLSFAGTIQ
ncbi:MAG: ATP-binding protein [Bacteroidota bacterium]